MPECPSKHQLERLLHEELSEPELTQVLIHVEDCTACQETLHGLACRTPGPTGLDLQSALSEIELGGPAAEAQAFLDRLKNKSSQEGPKPEVKGYEILEEIGRGATGVVYRARHQELNRLVALKMILAGPHLSGEGRLRFRREAQTVARLQHPNIVQIYDVGEHAGYPYLALELVEGATLAGWLNGSPQPARDAAQITATVANAIEYAHRQNVIHRDLKPANILVRLESMTDRAAGQSPVRAWPTDCLKITDFGLAKLFSAADGAADQVTQSNVIVGTPGYVAPEQARGDSAKVGPTADVYSIGVILYELLTGRPPFRGPTPMETLVQAAHQEPVLPSQLVPKTPADLQTICLKCLEKNPQKRYPSAAELAADLQRFLRHEPILARPVGWIERVGRWIRRHKALATTIAGVALLLSVVTIGSLLAATHFRKLEQDQRALTFEKGRLVDEKERERQKANEAEIREAGLHREAEKQAAQLRQTLYFARMNQIGHAAMSPSGGSRLGELLSPWEPTNWERDRPDLRQWEWYYLKGLCHRDRLSLAGHVENVTHVAWRPDGQRLASSGVDGTVRLWDAGQGREIATIAGHSTGLRSVAWNPSGTRLASAGCDGTVRIWNADTGRQMLLLGGHTGEVWAVVWSPDGRQLASGGADRTIQIWDPVSGHSVRVLRGHSMTVSGLAWSPNGLRLASSSLDKTIRLWEPKTGKETGTLREHQNWVTDVAWSPNGSQLASASNDETAIVWDPVRQTVLTTLRGHTEPVLSVAWSPDGTQLATGSDDQTVRIWSAHGGPATSILGGRAGKSLSVSWNPKGQDLASAHFDGTIKIWDAATSSDASPICGHEGIITSLSWRGDSRFLASSGSDGTVRVWDLRSGTNQHTLREHKGKVYSVSWHPNGEQLASAGNDETIRIWDVATPTKSRVLRGHIGAVFSVSWSPNGQWLASSGADRTVRVWNAVAGKQEQCFRGHSLWVRCVAWSPNNKSLATASWDKTVKVWDAVTGKVTFTLRGHTGEVTNVTWSPDGDELASASSDQTVKLWNAATGELIRTLRGHTAGVTSVVWSPDGMRLASASADRTIKVWDPRTGNEALSFIGQDRDANAVAWSPDGMVLVSGWSDKKILVYDATAGYVAVRAPQYLPMLDRHLAANPKNQADWRLRAEIHALQEDWDAAAADARKFFALNPEQRWLTLGTWIAGPYPEDLRASQLPENDVNPLNDGPGKKESPSRVRWQPVDSLPEN